MQMISGRKVIMDGSWIQDGCHSLSIEGLYDENHIFIHGGKVKAHQNGTIDLSGGGPGNCPECLFQFWKLKNPPVDRNIFCIQSSAYRDYYLFWDDKKWTVYLDKVDKKDTEPKIRWVIAMDPKDQSKKLLQAWDQRDPSASLKYLVFDFVNKEAKLENDVEVLRAGTSHKIGAYLVPCESCAEDNAAITITNYADIDINN